jgi:hypothetical protein
MRIRLGLPALAVAIVVVLVADIAVLTQRGKSTAVTFDDTVKSFRAGASAPTTSSTAAPEAGPSTAAAPATAANAARAGSTATPRVAAPTSPTTRAAAAPFTSPSEGVYSYKTRGFEEVSLGGGRHDYPDRSFATVRRRPGCDWQFEHKVLQEHIERRTQCSAPGQFSENEESVDVTFFGQTNSAAYRCDPALVLARTGDEPGTRRTGTCRADDGQAVLTVTFVGREAVTIAGSTVQALRVTMDGVVSGRADGTSHSDTWVHPDTGLMLRSTREVQTRAKAFGTTVDYREEARYELERLEPVR